MALSCPTCKRNFSIYFAVNEQFAILYPTCLCTNYIAFKTVNIKKYTYFNPNCYHQIFLEYVLSPCLDIVKPQRTFTNIDPSSEIKERFLFYKKKYKINKEFNNITEITLFNLLNALESNYQFNQFDLEWLKNEMLYTIAASYYSKSFNRDFSLWSLIKACSCWRKAGFPDIGMQMIESVKSNDSKVMAAILTTRGGACKDLKDLNTAEKCAWEALKYRVSKYPYSLLGAIYYLRGSPEKGDEYFKKAFELGQSKKEQDRVIFKAYLTAGKSEKDEILKYLSTHNPKRHLSLIQNESFKQAA